MAQALRGDFARLRARGIATTLARDEDEARAHRGVAAEAPAAAISASEAVEQPATPPPASTSGHEEAAAAVPSPDVPAEGEAPVPAPGWLGRMLGRR